MFTSGKAAMLSTVLRVRVGRGRLGGYALGMRAAAAAGPGRGEASAPASAANLGPGFDVVAIALAMRCKVSVIPAAAWSLRSAEADQGSMTLVRNAAEAAVPRSGPFSVTVDCAIPVGRGLGASAALVVGLIGAVSAAAGLPVNRDEVARIATAVEGHPDNVAAAVHGGAVAVSAGGRVHHLEVHPSLQVLVAVPRATLPTRAARAALADPVDTATAARTAARLAFLVEGLRRGDAELLAEAAGDELHEKRRAHLSPLTGRLVAAARNAGAIHAAWSGAGPSAVALATVESLPAVRAAWESLLAGEGGKVLDPGLDRDGIRVGGAT
jgi:homoserine kinase